MSKLIQDDCIQAMSNIESGSIKSSIRLQKIKKRIFRQRL
nr:MAG TPA: hypothetical protein [Caudoviricetes sp.]